MCCRLQATTPAVQSAARSLFPSTVLRGLGRCTPASANPHARKSRTGNGVFARSGFRPPLRDLYQSPKRLCGQSARPATHCSATAAAPSNLSCDVRTLSPERCHRRRAVVVGLPMRAGEDLEDTPPGLYAGCNKGRAAGFMAARRPTRPICATWFFPMSKPPSDRPQSPVRLLGLFLWRLLWAPIFC